MDNFEANNNNNYNNDNPKNNKNNRKKWLIGVGIALASFIVISLGITFVKGAFKVIDQYAAQMAGSDNANGNAERCSTTGSCQGGRTCRCRNLHRRCGGCI